MMKEITPLVLLAAILSGCNGSVDIAGFGGHKWGATKAEILQDRGEPVLEMNRPGAAFATFDARRDETLAGYPLDSATYWFKDACSEPTTLCYLWGGVYD